MRLSGRVVAGLGELPSDWAPLPALLRLAGQARVPQRNLPEALLTQGRWRLIRTEDEAHRAESAWLNFHTGAGEPFTPGTWLASLAVRRLGPALLHAGTRPVAVGAASVLLALLGVGLGWIGSATLGFVLLALAWIVLRTSSLLTRVEQVALLEQPGGLPAARIIAGLLDLGFVVVCARRSDIPLVAGVPWGLGWFASLVLFLLLRLFPDILADRAWTVWLRDRFSAGLVLSAVSALLPFDLVVRILILCLIAAAFVRPRKTGAIS